MNNFITIAYYTPRYKDEAFGLSCSCFEKGVLNYIKEVAELGNWDANTHYKPTFIKECLQKFQTDLLYVDADARFDKYPELIHTIESDVAYYRGDVWGHGNVETLSGTLYFKYNGRVLALLDRWIAMCESSPNAFDQALFAEALSCSNTSIQILPVEYCAIFDAPAIKQEDVVIRHLQASRRLMYAK